MNASRPEHDFLIGVARRELGPAAAAKLRRLARLDLDWDYLLALANQHGLIPLLQKHASQATADLLPSLVRTRLKQESVENTQSVLYLTSKALEVARLFRAHRIPAACFKGPLLSEVVYGEMALRQAGDIDLLIAREHFFQARKLLESLGYQMYPQLTPAQLSSHLAFHCEIQFMRDEWFTVVDLHWGLAPRSFVFGLHGEEVMTRLQTVVLAGSPLETFSPEDLLLYQAMHGAKHLWRKLEWISSLAALVQAFETSSWPTLVERTLKARATKILALGLRLVETLFETSAPSEVLAVVDGDRAMDDFAQKICAQLFDDRHRLDSSDTNIYNLKIMDRKRDALVSTLRALLVPTLSDWQALSLPDPLHSLYYAVRPFRLSKAYTSSLLRKLILRKLSQRSVN